MPTTPPTSRTARPTTASARRQAYARRAYPLYRPSHVQRAMAMVLKAIGLEPQGRLNALMTRAGLWFLRSRVAKYAAQRL